MGTTKVYPTWLSMWTKIASDLEIVDEDFVDETEARGYANEAIDEAEAEIHKLHEEYFLCREAIALVAGTTDYILPTSIYAHKIRQILCYDASGEYSLKRLGTLNKFLQYRAAARESENLPVGYLIINSVVGVPKISLTGAVASPVPSCEIWFYRNANRFETTADTCDIPEFSNFIVNFVKERIHFKIEAGSMKHQKATSDVERLRGLMITTLKDMVIDGDNGLEPDTSHYEEHE